MMKKLAQFVVAAALVAAPLSQVRAACVAPGDGEALMTYFLPAFVSQMAVICQGHLPAADPLMDPNGPRRVALQAEAEAARPAAFRGIAALSDVSITDLAGVGTELEAAIRESASESLAGELTAADCPKIGTAFEAVAAMSGRDLAKLAMVFAGDDAINVCRAD